MRSTRIAAAAGIFLSTIATTSWATEVPTIHPVGTASTVIAGHTVPLLAGGLYDRFHSNPPLSVIAS